MNIVVTTPKSEVETSKQEAKDIKKTDGYWFRVFKFKLKVDPGDRIYFVENGLIRGYGVIFDIQQLFEPAKCDTTGRCWGKQGDWIIKYNRWTWLTTPLRCKGFQGIRYIKNKIEDYVRKTSQNKEETCAAQK